MENNSHEKIEKLSAIDKFNMIRGMFNPEFFKDKVRPHLYKLANDDPEVVHEIILNEVSKNKNAIKLLSPFFKAPEELKIKVNNLEMAPFGISAGFDKNGDALEALSCFFGFLEPGTVVVNIREGNQKPRVATDDKNLDLYNAQGFPSKGLDYFMPNLIAYKKSNPKTPVFVNMCGMPIAENNAIEVAMNEMEVLLKKLEPYVDGFVWNCASPNTAALQMLRTREIFSRTSALMKELAPNKLRLVKMWPYEEADKNDTMNFVRSFIEAGGHGVVSTNTKMFKKEEMPVDKWGYPSAGRSGSFLKSYRLRSVKDLREEFPDAIIVATGGIYDGNDAYETFKAGANMIEGYTPYTFYGVGLLKKIESGVISNMQKDGIKNLSELQSTVKEKAAKQN